VIAFLNNPIIRAQFQQLAQGHQAPDFSTFAADYQAGITWMQNWMEQGCQTTQSAMDGPSEMLHNIYLWVHSSQ
jgi:negative regulator of sigma E activity